MIGQGLGWGKVRCCGRARTTVGDNIPVRVGIRGWIRARVRLLLMRWGRVGIKDGLVLGKGI